MPPLLAYEIPDEHTRQTLNAVGIMHRVFYNEREFTSAGIFAEVMVMGSVRTRIA